MDKIKVMVNGLPGKMATIIAEGILSSGYELADVALTGPDQPESTWIHGKSGSIADKQVYLIPPEAHETVLKEVNSNIPNIDFCKGKGVADRNAELYIKNNIPFVMGSTGVSNDYKDIERLAIEHENPCVAAPNMDCQIVSLMDMVHYGAKHYGGSWDGYFLKLAETHQADKINKETGLPETSGTMKAMRNDLNALTNQNISVEEILSTRDPKAQLILWQVPEQWLGQHAYHIFKAFKPVEGGEDSLVITLKRHGGECYRTGVMMALDWIVDGIKRNLFDTYDGKKPESQDNRKYFNTMFNVLRKD